MDHTEFAVMARSTIIFANQEWLYFKNRCNRLLTPAWSFKKARLQVASITLDRETRNPS
jgi:hypothetical protein